MQAKSDGTKVALDDILERDLVFAGVKHGLVEFSISEPSLSLLLIQAKRLLQMFLGLVEGSHSQIVVTQESLHGRNVVWLVDLGARRLNIFSKVLRLSVH
jgi:hypothetical protein